MTDGKGAEGSMFTPVLRRSAAADAAAQIKDLILRGVLGPGDKLPVERELAVSLGVSRPTLRSAIHSLVSMGMLEARHGSGTYVTDLAASKLAEPLLFAVERNERFVDSLFDVRTILEAAAAERAASRLSPEDIAEMRRYNAALAGADEARDDVLAIDTALHRTIHLGADNPVLLALLDSLSELARRGRAASLRPAANRRKVFAQHAAVIDALEAGDGAAARRAMLQHLEYVREVVGLEE